jgi:cytochrome c
MANDQGKNDQRRSAGDLFWNKIFGSILGTLLVVFALNEISHDLVHAATLEKPAYPIEVKEAPAGGAPAGPAQPDDVGALLAAANKDQGAQLAKTLCTSCHNFDENGANMTGPNLYGVVGRQVATHAGFNYTPAMKGKGGNWTYEALWTYLEAPQKVVPGTAMTFTGLPKKDQRANVIAYLSTLSHSPVPFPAPGAAAPASAGGAPAAPAGQAPAGSGH